MGAEKDELIRGCVSQWARVNEIWHSKWKVYCVMLISSLLSMSGTGRVKDGFISRTGQT